MTDSRPLKLFAVDPEDLAVISTHLQDARINPHDMVWLPSRMCFALVLDRFDWCSARSGEQIRHRSGLHFDRVTRVKRLNFNPASSEPVVLLSIVFQPVDIPAGAVTLYFEGGGAIRLYVECLEAAMSDLGEDWPCTDPPPPRL